MKLIGRKGIPTDVFDGNEAISNDKLILYEGRFKRGNYSYVTNKWFWIEEFERVIIDLEGEDELIWFEKEV